MMKSFGPDKIVCIDSTHGTNEYDFFLISILVVDEYGEGFPVAWCLSNRQDEFLLTNLFEAVRKRVGSCVPCVLMSDDAEQFYTAWIDVFGLGPKKLLCTWHVDQDMEEKPDTYTQQRHSSLSVQKLRYFLKKLTVKSLRNC